MYLRAYVLAETPGIYLEAKKKFGKTQFKLYRS